MAAPPSGPSADDEVPKEFPDVSQKLSAPKKLSAFEKERQAAEEKKRRAEAETAAALKEFEDSFGKYDDDDDAYDGFPNMNFRAPPGRRGPSSGSGSGTGSYHGHGGQPGRQGGPYSSTPRSGPGSLGPPLGGPPPNMRRKRALDEMREAQEARREQEDFAEEYMSKAPKLREGHSPSRTHLDNQKDVEARPTVQLTSLPPSITIEHVKKMLGAYVGVHSVELQLTTGPSVGRTSFTAIATLESETSVSKIDTAVSALKDKYLGDGFRLSISRHLSSTSLVPTLPGVPSVSSFEPFGAQKPSNDQSDRFNMRNAPPPSDFAPPNSYGLSSRHAQQASPSIAVRPPLDMPTVRAIHTMVDRLLSEPNPARALQIEALLMAQPDVRKDERFSFLYDSTSTAGVYYRYLLWNDGDCYDAIQERKRFARGPEHIFDDVPIEWLAPQEQVPFADLSKLGEAIDHLNYESSDEESDDGNGERKFNNSRREGEVPSESTDKRYLTPLQVAKFAWLLSTMPTNHAKLRKADVAAITYFAINHAGAGAEEIVDMLVLNVEKPYANTQCGKFDSEDVSHDEDDVYEPDEELPSIESAPPSDSARKGEKKEGDDPSQAKLVALYLISDVLHNSSTAGVRNSWKYRQLFESAFKRQKTFEHLGRLEKELGWGRIKAEQWRNRIRNLFEVWENGSIFASDVFDALKKSFFDQPIDEGEAKRNAEGQSKDRSKGDDRGSASPLRLSDYLVTPSIAQLPLSESALSDTADVDEVPVDDMDGAPMDDIDGAPMDDLDGALMQDVDGAPLEDTPMEDSPAQETPVQDLTDVPTARSTKAGFSIKAASDSFPAVPSGPGRRRLAEDMFADSDED